MGHPSTMGSEVGERFDDATWVLALTHRGLVVTIARHYEHRGLDLDDLIQEGFCGVCRALVRYDPARAKLSTYLSLWIKEGIRRALRDTGRTIRVPVHALTAAAKDPDTLTPRRRKIATAGRHARDDWHRGRAGDPDVLTLVAAADLCDDFDPDPEPIDFGPLTDRERQIVREHYGLEGLSPRTMQVIGDELGLHPSRVSRIEHKAFAKLREAAGD